MFGPKLLFRRATAVLPLLLVVGIVACADEVTSQESGRAVAPAVPASAAAQDTPLATVDGETITRADLEEIIGDQLALLEHQYGSQLYELLDAGVTELMRQRLVEAEAETRGVSVEVLMNEEIESKISVTDGDIEAWYALNQQRLQGRPLQQLREPIRQFLQDQQREELMIELTDALSEGREVAVHLEPYRVDFDHSDQPVWGPADAPVTVLEFSDFECPYCSGFTSTLQQIKTDYEGRIRVVYRQLPLTQIHPNAQKAAEASLCANDQGKFWELHDVMFAEQSLLGVADLKRKAGRLGLDQATFDACLDSGQYAERVAEDVRVATRLGIDGTPAVFVNGRPLTGGAVPYEMLQEIIDDELERAR